MSSVSRSFPSPTPRRTPAVTPSRSFPYVFAPQLPHRGTAIARLKANLAAFLVFCALWRQGSAYLWVKTSVQHVLTRFMLRENVGWGIDAFEIVVFSLLSWNIIEAAYAIYRSPTLAPPVAVPPKNDDSTIPLSPVQRRLRGISSSSLNSRSSSTPLITPSYASSPLSTPTRIGAPSRSSYLSSSTSGPSGLNLAGSLSSSALGGSTSGSPLAAYMGKHSPEAGRALDGSVLKRLMSEIDS
ncbi:hypothetical protein BOTBODRAFT_28221 [Botryobasidium botryosum FD-172 SS1]|uniref:Uncharacterized protein n=1 Tax=Botryobasidium botryosum (strain FD-172 SS1) TaxID=930990 RepID=A0A067N784_BOTB1|nr:hypothetical protein BOTBODRAFT_28221 [Botryobasidium botryosum FD-172 SS1]